MTGFTVLLLVVTAAGNLLGALALGLQRNAARGERDAARDERDAAVKRLEGLIDTQRLAYKRLEAERDAARAEAAGLTSSLREVTELHADAVAALRAVRDEAARRTNVVLAAASAGDEYAPQGSKEAS